MYFVDQGESVRNASVLHFSPLKVCFHRRIHNTQVLTSWKQILRIVPPRRASWPKTSRAGEMHFKRLFFMVLVLQLTTQGDDQSGEGKGKDGTNVTGWTEDATLTLHMSEPVNWEVSTAHLRFLPSQLLINLGYIQQLTTDYKLTLWFCIYLIGQYQWRLSCLWMTSIKFHKGNDTFGRQKWWMLIYDSCGFKQTVVLFTAEM